MILGVTGHRPVRLPCKYDENHPWKKQTFIQIENFLKENSVDKLYTGMALGFDIWCAEVCLNLSIPYISIIPFQNTGDRWSREVTKNWNRILNKSKKVICLELENSKEAFLIRDKFLVDKIEIQKGQILSLFDGIKKGGTYYTLKYAEEKKIPVSNIYDSIKNS